MDPQPVEDYRGKAPAFVKFMSGLKDRDATRYNIYMNHLGNMKSIGKAYDEALALATTREDGDIADGLKNYRAKELQN